MQTTCATWLQLAGPHTCVPLTVRQQSLTTSPPKVDISSRARTMHFIALPQQVLGTEQQVFLRQSLKNFRRNDPFDELIPLQVAKSGNASIVRGYKQRPWRVAPSVRTRTRPLGRIAALVLRANRAGVQRGSVLHRSIRAHTIYVVKSCGRAIACVSNRFRIHVLVQG